MTLIICCDSGPQFEHDLDTTIIIPIGKQTSQEHDTFRIDRFHDIESGIDANQCQHSQRWHFRILMSQALRECL